MSNDFSYPEVFDNFLFPADAEGLAKYAEERNIDLEELKEVTTSGIDRDTIQRAIDLEFGI